MFTLPNYVDALDEGVASIRLGLSNNKERAVYSVLTLENHILKGGRSFNYRRIGGECRR